MEKRRAIAMGNKIQVKVDIDLEALIPGFFENRMKDILSLQEAVKQHDFETIRILGHTMKGAGGGYGFHAITDIGSALENAAKEKKTEAIMEHIDELIQYIENIDIVYG